MVSEEDGVGRVRAWRNDAVIPNSIYAMTMDELKRLNEKIEALELQAKRYREALEKIAEGFTDEAGTAIATKALQEEGKK